MVFRRALHHAWLLLLADALTPGRRWSGGVAPRRAAVVPASSPGGWSGDGKSQDELMEYDRCVWVSETDELLGTRTKKEAHVFDADRPRGFLHRAFSVFLFDAEGRLLLQRRAASKLTFPGVWTNTVCSHPLAGLVPDEVDGPDRVADGSVPGIKAAASRKLAHELGIVGADPAAFKYLTRLRYAAPSEIEPWGEHEVDYVLLFRPRDAVDLAPDPDEVMDTRYVDAAELAAMMADPGLTWSPWFRIIAENFLPAWWDDLDAALTTDRHDDFDTIHFLDPS